MQPLLTDAGRPLKRSLHIETMKMLDGERAQFNLAVPGPAVLRHVYARELTVQARIIGGKKQHGILVVAVFEVDPDAAPIARSIYCLPFGQVIEGSAVADMLYAGTATLPNGAPVAVYEMPVT